MSYGIRRALAGMHRGAIGICGPKFAMALALVFAGCGAQDDHVDGKGEKLGAQTADIAAVRTEVALGSSGTDVLAVHQYLAGAGYFPNDALARDFPAWRPIVSEGPGDPMVFDENSAHAVREFQEHNRLNATGIVDANTLAVMRLARCGVPEGIQPTDPSSKYNINKRIGSALTWRTVNAPLGFAAFDDAVAKPALATWAAATSLTFTRAATGATADIEFRFQNGGPLAVATPGPAGTTTQWITFNTSEKWSLNVGVTGDCFTNPAVECKYDMQTVALHEIGHVLGLLHSSIDRQNCFIGDTTCPDDRSVMWSNSENGSNGRSSLKRSLRLDDLAAINANYDQYEVMDTCTKDVDLKTVPGGNAFWVVACGDGDQPIWQRVNGSWVQDNQGAGTRIAVDSQGRPWVVNSLGEIWFKASKSASTGSWTKITGCATDIGAGPKRMDGTDNTVWVITCTASGSNFRVGRVSSDSHISLDSGAGSGVRISVDNVGRPWVITAAGQLFRKSSGSVLSGTWSALVNDPQRPLRDVGVGTLNYASIGGNAGRIFSWMEQDARDTSAGPGQNPVAVATTVENSLPIGFPFFVAGVAADDAGSAFFADSVGNLWRPKK